MSDVRLSNASPTVERVDARQQDAVRPPVRRALFGEPDPGETRRYLEELVRDGTRDFIETYNFDPVNERPLPPGNFEWEAEGEGGGVDDAPEFYRRPPHRREDRGSRCCTNGSRKRPAGASGSCSDECSSSSSKRSNSDDREDPPDSSGSQAVERAGGPESGEAVP